MQLVFDFLEALRTARAYPKKGNLLGSKDGEPATSDDLAVWEECFEVARSYCALLLEVHLGLNADEERQLFHDLNRLRKAYDAKEVAALAREVMKDDAATRGKSFPAYQKTRWPRRFASSKASRKIRCSSRVTPTSSATWSMATSRI